MKTFDIVLSAPPYSEIRRIVVSLGGFSLLMYVLGRVGFIMADTGLAELLTVIYAENFVSHTYTNWARIYAYTTAVRAHILVYLALSKIILQNID